MGACFRQKPRAEGGLVAHVGEAEVGFLEVAVPSEVHLFRYAFVRVVRASIVGCRPMVVSDLEKLSPHATANESAGREGREAYLYDAARAIDVHRV